MGLFRHGVYLSIILTDGPVCLVEKLLVLVQPIFEQRSCAKPSSLGSGSDILGRRSKTTAVFCLEVPTLF